MSDEIPEDAQLVDRALRRRVCAALGLSEGIDLQTIYNKLDDAVRADIALREIGMLFDELRSADGEPSPTDVLAHVRALRDGHRTYSGEQAAPARALADVDAAVRAGVTGALLRVSAELLPDQDWPDTSDKNRAEWTARVRVVRQLLILAKGGPDAD